MPAPDFSALTQRQIAAIFGVDERTVRRWSDEPENPMPRNSDATYSAPLCVAWYTRREVGAELDLNQERARLAKEQADKTSLDNEQRRGRLLDAAGVAQTWAEHIANARSRLLAMATKLAAQLTNVADANIIAARIRAEVHAALWELVIDDRSTADTGASDPDVEATAGPDDKPVGGQKSPPKRRK